MTVPFGGYRQSGFGGKEKSLAAVDQWTRRRPCGSSALSGLGGPAEAGRTDTSPGRVGQHELCGRWKRQRHNGTVFATPDAATPQRPRRGGDTWPVVATTGEVVAIPPPGRASCVLTAQSQLSILTSRGAGAPLPVSTSDFRLSK